MTCWLLDGNVLLALTIDTHIFHNRAERWLGHLTRTERIATCPVTEGTLLRLHMRLAADRSAAAAWATLNSIHAHPKHEFWKDNPSYLEVAYERLTKPTQLTDAWLATLAKRNGGKVATLDEEFAILHGEVAMLVPVM